MADSWYCSLKSGVWGPIGKDDLDKILKKGFLNKKTWVRREEEKEWIALGDAGIFPPDVIPDAPPKPEKEKSSSEPKVKEKNEQPIEEKKVDEDKAPEPVTPVREETNSEKAKPVQSESVEEKEEQADKAPSPISTIEEGSNPEGTSSTDDEAELAVGEKGLQALQSKSLNERKEQAKSTIGLYRLFWTRVMKSDFSVIKSTQAEVEKLESGKEKVNSPLAQDYASWRLSMLKICILVLAVSTFFNFFGFVSELGKSGTPWVLNVQKAFIFIFQVVSLVMCIRAARNWHDLGRSRSLSRFAWLLQFMGPFLILLIPLTMFSKILPEQLFTLGLTAVILLTPKVFGLFPGLIRCSLTIKTLLPESSTPGWLAIIIAPTYTLFLAVATITAIQSQQMFMGAGLAMMMIGMLSVLFKAKGLLKPADQTDASRSVRDIKRKQLIFQLIGFACFMVAFWESIDFAFIINACLFIFSFIANVTLLTLVMSDLMLGMIRQGQLQANAFAGTPLEKSLGDRLEDLEACGLTDLKAGEAEFAERLRQKSGFLSKQS